MEKQFLPLYLSSFLPFDSPVEGTYNEGNYGCRAHVPPRLRKRHLPRVLSVLPALASILLFVIVTLYICHFRSSKKIEARHLARRLAEGGKDEGNHTSEVPEVCETLGAALASQQEAEGQRTEPLFPARAFPGIEEGSGQPRGRKRKKEWLARWLEESGEFGGEQREKRRSGGELTQGPCLRHIFTFLN